ncbi:hypothetical protein L3i20_v220820 [Paenibacillus sp. L3-i20]|nr:hypothetical protein L3i20_v220820 [Paenibacillus sp. L3-i20]
MVEDVLLRVDDQAELEEMDEVDEEEINRHTRRAPSQFGDLQRLTASPLTQLKLIDCRLRERGANDEIVECVIQLKTILLESIEHLKPKQEEAFATTDEWRFYNALYFPYIIGIKPYGLRYSASRLDSSSLEAYQWFRTYVPERTYYNWQNAGAKLVALMLKEKLLSHLSEQCEALANIAAESLHKPRQVPFELGPFRFNTAGELFNFAVGHEAVHLGIISGISKVSQKL